MLKVKKLDPNAILPSVVHAGEDLGYDLYALEDTVLRFGGVTKVRTGVSAQAYRYFRLYGSAPHYYPVLQENINPLGLLIRDRSSMASKGIVTSGGVIDHGYTGEIVVMMTNHNKAHTYPCEVTVPGPTGLPSKGIRNVPGYQIKAGDKIAQMVPIPILTGTIVEVEELSGGVRGDKGFGSSGK